MGAKVTNPQLISVIVRDAPPLGGVVRRGVILGSLEAVIVEAIHTSLDLVPGPLTNTLVLSILRSD